MTLHKSDAIILKRDRSGESSLLVQAFLKHAGRQNMLANGARKPGSALVGKLEPYSEVQVMYYQKNDESLATISQISQIRTNADLSGDIRRLSYAAAVVEAIENMIFPDSEQEHLYNLITSTFYMMNYSSAKKLEFYFLVFLLKSLDLLGLSPQFDVCVKTGQPIESEEVFFGIEEGGIISREYANGGSGYFKLDQGIIKAVRAARQNSIDQLKGLNFSDKQKEIIKDLLFSFLNYHTDSKPSFNSLNFLSKLANF